MYAKLNDDNIGERKKREQSDLTQYLYVRDTHETTLPIIIVKMLCMWFAKKKQRVPASGRECVSTHNSHSLVPLFLWRFIFSTTYKWTTLLTSFDWITTEKQHSNTKEKWMEFFSFLANLLICSYFFLLHVTGTQMEFWNKQQHLQIII